MLDTANPSDLLLIQIMTGLRHRYEFLNRQYEEQLINDFRVNAPGISARESARPSWCRFFSLAARYEILQMTTRVLGQERVASRLARRTSPE
jgi:hypothetical protein